jgi:large conductance mechanosensitive channel
VKQVNNLKKRFDKPVVVAAPATKDCPFCASAIPVRATRCPHCTSQL